MRSESGTGDTRYWFFCALRLAITRQITKTIRRTSAVGKPQYAMNTHVGQSQDWLTAKSTPKSGASSTVMSATKEIAAIPTVRYASTRSVTEA